MSIGALEGVDDRDAGVASGLVNTTQQIGGALGVAVLSTIALSTTNSILAAHPHVRPENALTQGFADALLAGAFFALAGALLTVLLTARRSSQSEPESDTARAESVLDRAA